MEEEKEKMEKGRKRDAMIRRRDAYAQGRKINYSTPFDLRVQATTYRTEYRNRPRELLYSVCIYEKNGGGVGKSVNRDYCNYCISTGCLVQITHNINLCVYVFENSHS